MNKTPRYQKFKADISKNFNADISKDKEIALPLFDVIHVIEISLKIIVLSIVATLLTLFFIFIQNAVVQSNFLAIKEISVTGTNILSKEEVIEQAELYPEDNIFSANLRHTKLRVISHPWIEDASVKRYLPSKIVINIKEEIPLAVVHIPNSADIIINSKGVPFTENDAIGSDIYINDLRNSVGMNTVETKNDKTAGKLNNDKTAVKLNNDETAGKLNNDKTAVKLNNDETAGKLNINDSKKFSSNIKDQENIPSSSDSSESNLILPVITGLRLVQQDGIYKFAGRTYNSVMEVLLIKDIGIIQKISADEESGIEIDIISTNLSYKSKLTKQPIEINSEDKQIKIEPIKIKIGFDNYKEKFKIIRHIINYMQKHKNDKQICSIDLVNPENVVVKVKDIGTALPEHIDGGA